MKNSILRDASIIVKYGSVLTTVAVAFALVLPSHTLPGAYGTLSDTLGFAFTAAWSYSFYPQVFLNYKRRSVEGLSIDFQLLNLLGFLCYSAYNLALFTSAEVQQQYREAYSDNIPVGLEDVLFSVHAAAITAVTLGQCIAYRTPDTRFFTAVGKLCAGAAAAATGAAVFVALGGAELQWATWMNLLLGLSFVKLLVSLTKYIPQVVLNQQRRSTDGWNIWNVLLDFTGGVLSLAQVFLKCAVTSDWSQINGNPVKFGLGMSSMVFDIIFMVQHYILFRSPAVLPEDIAAEEQALHPASDGEGSLSDGGSPPAR